MTTTTNRYCSTCLVTRTFVRRDDVLQCPMCGAVLIIAGASVAGFRMVRDRGELARDEEDSRF